MYEAQGCVVVVVLSDLAPFHLLSLPQIWHLLAEKKSFHLLVAVGRSVHHCPSVVEWHLLQYYYICDCLVSDDKTVRWLAGNNLYSFILIFSYAMKLHPILDKIDINWVLREYSRSPPPHTSPKQVSLPNIQFFLCYWLLLAAGIYYNNLGHRFLAKWEYKYKPISLFSRTNNELIQWGCVGNR